MENAVTASELDLSVVIVAYRVRDQVCDCLRTLYGGGGLRGLRAQVIIVDNAGGDGTVEAVRQQFPLVRVIAETENGGFARANNTGIAQATGRNILLLNPDTLVPDGALAACVSYLDTTSPKVGAMTCRVEGSDGLVQWTCSRRSVTPWSECCRALLLDRLFARSRFFNPEPMIGWDRADERSVECLLGAFMLIRHSTLAKIGGLDDQFFLMYEDVDWCERARKAGYELRFWPGARITHLGGESWKQEPIATFANSHASALRFLGKHYPHSVATVRAVHRAGMELKIALLRLNLLRKPGDPYTRKHLAMARAARTALRTGTVDTLPPASPQATPTA